MENHERFDTDHSIKYILTVESNFENISFSSDFEPDDATTELKHEA